MNTLTLIFHFNFLNMIKKALYRNINANDIVKHYKSQDFKLRMQLI